MTSSMQPKTDPITDAKTLWSSLVSSAGLDVAPRSDGAPAHDHDLEVEIRRSLNLDRSLPFLDALTLAPTVGPTELLNAVFGALVPWVAMMRDILGMLDQASAEAGGDELSIRVEWDDLDAPLREELSSFRRQVRLAGSVLAASYGERWGELQFELLPSRYDLEIEGGGNLVPKLEGDVPKSKLSEWFERYRSGKLDAPPSMPPTGNVEYDSCLRQLTAAVASHIRALSLLGGDWHSRLREVDALGDVPLPDGWTAENAVRLDQDFISAHKLVDFGNAPIHRNWARVGGEITRRVREQLDQVESVPLALSPKSLLQDILDLPIWKKRFELYSVWVATQIVEGSGFVPRWITPNGELSFSFGGSRIAAFDLNGSTAILWAELRRETKLTLAGHGRTSAVQPDYTVLLSDSDVADAGLVVECKHYRKASRRNFEDAINDYALVHGNASVALVNYTVVGALTVSSRSAEATGFGEMRPGGANQRPFREFVERAFSTMNSISGLFPSATTVQLDWADGGDLDLHVTRKDRTNCSRVSFANFGSRSSSPWMVLLGDQRSGPGTEVVEVHRAGGAALSVHVHRYEGEWPSQPPRIRITRDLLELEFIAPPYEPGRDWWHVCDVDLRNFTSSLGRGFVQEI